MTEVYVGNIDPNVSSHELRREFKAYGEIRRIKLPSAARGYAFVEFVDLRDALFAILSLNGKFNWRVELSRKSQFDLDNSAPASSRCFRCGGFGHLASHCASACDIKKKGVKQSQRGRMKKNQVASTSTWKPVPPPPPPWVELPEDITAKILQKLGSIGLLWSAQNVCTTWRRVCRDPTMWRVIDIWKFDEDTVWYDIPYVGYDVLCRRAVDLSQGQVIEFSIEDFLSDDLLEYIAERCGQLRCLSLTFCKDVSGETLSKAVKRFPLLEELHLRSTPFNKDDIEAIGHSSPMLRTFALNVYGCTAMIFQSNEEALAISKAMPELRCLQLNGNRMTNEGLEAILNGCPKLESLDIRECSNLDLEGDLGKRCVRQIKNLLRPSDSTADYKFAHWSAYEYPSDDSYYDYAYDDLDYDDYDDFCDPFQFDVGSEDLFLDDYYGSLF